MPTIKRRIRRPGSLPPAASKKLWAKIKQMRMQGGLSYSEIRAKLQREFPKTKIPTVSTMSARACKKKWAIEEESGGDPKVAERLASVDSMDAARLQKELEKCGMSERKRAELLSSGAKDSNKRVALVYLQEIHKLLGSYAPQKKAVDHTSGGEKISGPMIYLPDNGRGN